MLTVEEIKKISKEFCRRTQIEMDCDECTFSGICVPIYEVSARWWDDGTEDTWKSGFQKWLEEQVEAKKGSEDME